MIAIQQPALPAYAEHFTASFEGCELRAYNRDGHWTWGYGHTGIMPDGQPVGPHTTGTCALAHQLLLQDLRHAASAVSAAATAGGLLLTEGELVALTDLVFNCGVGLLGSEHTLGQRLAAGDRAGLAKAILLYENATIDGVRGPYLRKRRQMEYAVYHGQTPEAENAS